MHAKHHALKQVGALLIQESTFYQVNMIQQVLTQHSELQDNLQASIDQQVKENLLSALTDFTSSHEPPQDHVINNITNKANDVTTDKLLQMIETLSTKVDELKHPADTDINPRTGKKFKRYCWSYGCCPHWGKTARTKNQDTRTSLTSRIAWVEATKTAFQRNNEGQETQEL